MNTFLLNVSPFEPKIWRRHCSTGLQLNSCMKFCPMFPYRNQNSGATPVHLISIHLSTVICTLSQKNKTLSLFQNLKKITVINRNKVQLQITNFKYTQFHPHQFLITWYAFVLSGALKHMQSGCELKLECDPRTPKPQPRRYLLNVHDLITSNNRGSQGFQ